MSDVFYINNTFNNVTIPKHFHNEYTISLVYNGQHLFSNEKDKFKISPGIIQVVNPYEIHETNHSSWAHINIMANIELINSIASDILQKDVDETIFLNTSIQDDTASYLFISLFETFEYKENKLAVDNGVVEFLDYLLRNHSSIKKGDILSSKTNKKDFSTTLDYIEDNISNVNISLEELALNAGLSKFHFSREFKKHFGISPSNYIQIKKVNKVRDLLKTNMSLTDISYSCGFYDQSYMIKVFKKYNSYTPSQIQTLS